MVDTDVALGDDAGVDVGLVTEVVDEVDTRHVLAQGGRERPEAEPRRFWADQRPKTGGRSRPPCARREVRKGLAASSMRLNRNGLGIWLIALVFREAEHPLQTGVPLQAGDPGSFWVEKMS